MDQETLTAYSQRATEYSQDWLSQPEPTDMYQLLKTYFLPEGESVDIGCGNGRDASWMNRNGYHVVGYDASLELIALASKHYPTILFEVTTLPNLHEVQKQYDNVLCETVIMHLPKSQISQAIQNLKRIIKKGGILYLSWRVTEGQDQRQKDGRLYSAFDAKFIFDQFPQKSILHFEEKISMSSGKKVCRLIYKSE